MSHMWEGCHTVQYTYFSNKVEEVWFSIVVYANVTYTLDKKQFADAVMLCCRKGKLSVMLNQT